MEFARLWVRGNRCRFVAVEAFAREACDALDLLLRLGGALTQDAGWLTGGEVIWTSGNNDGRRMEVKEFASTQVVLALPMGKSIQVGDTFDIIAGCDKTRETCQSKFSNIINFRGEPDVPGTDKLLTTAGTLDKTNRNG